MDGIETVHQAAVQAGVQAGTIEYFSELEPLLVRAGARP
jgi:hypothetical protein